MVVEVVGGTVVEVVGGTVVVVGGFVVVVVVLLAAHAALNDDFPMFDRVNAVPLAHDSLLTVPSPSTVLTVEAPSANPTPIPVTATTKTVKEAAVLRVLLKNLWTRRRWRWFQC